MGQELLLCWKHKINKEIKLAFFFTFSVALLIHLYKFTNTLPNHDSLYNYYTDQNILKSGRWALSLACSISSYYDLPWINGLFSCLFLAAAAAVIVSLFQVRNPVVISLSGALLASSISTTETFFFLFTADGYMLAMLLASLSVYYSRVNEMRGSRLLLSGVCLCIACGIYQAYVSFALVLALLYFMYVLLSGKIEKKDGLRWVFRQFILYVLSLTIYFIIWKVCMRVQGVQASTYQGISNVGSLSLGLVRNGFRRSIRSFLLYFLQWDVLDHGFSYYAVINLFFFAFFLLGLFLSVFRSGLLKKKWALLLFMLCLLAIIPFASIWHFVSYSVGYRPMMLHCYTLLFIFVALLYEKWFGTVIKNVIACFLLVVIINNSLMANISYFYMNLSYERSYADGLMMAMRIRELEREQPIQKVAVVGSRLSDVSLPNIDPDTGKIQPSGQLQLLTANLETSLLFDSPHLLPFLKYTFGMEYPSVSQQDIAELAASEIVKNMPSFPSCDSIIVENGICIIKLSEDIEYS